MTRFYPEGLRRLPIWVLWRLEDRGGRGTKVPYSARYHGRASSTDSSSWSSFEDALAEWNRDPGFYRGIGVVISPESRLIFIDVDHAIGEDGEIDARGRDILDAFPDQFAEVSQSGHGLHVFTLGEIPRSFKNSRCGVEMYSGKRFAALTGNAIMSGEPSECPSGLAYVFRRYSTPRATINAREQPSVPLIGDDRRLIEKASAREGRFRQLFTGNWQGAGYASQSEADAALCLLLAFWTDGDPERIDRIFRSSGLYRAKWEREDYRTGTITRACGYCRETLSEFIRRREREKGDALERVFIQYGA